jgi:hypothetical protein
MLENRLDTQIQFLKKNSDIDVVGSFAYDVDSDYKIVGQSTRPESHEEIINLIYKENPFVHPTVLAKKNFFKNLHGYDTSLKRAQDYDLWLRGYKKFNYHNIQIPLIKYRRREKTKFRDCLYSFWVLQKNFYRDIKNYRIFFSSFRPIAAWILRKIIFFVSGKKNII